MILFSDEMRRVRARSQKVELRVVAVLAAAILVLPLLFAGWL